MRLRASHIGMALCLLALGLLAAGGVLAQNDGADDATADETTAVQEIAIDGAIGPATSDYIRGALTDAAAADAPLVILRLDTPGGLDGAMREIVQAVLASPVPVAAYVGPAGARAASAGTYILYASHVAAMAPATNLGAATPVSMGGDSPAAPEGDPDGETRDGDSEADRNDAGEEATREPETADNATAKRRKVVNDAVAYIRSLAERRDRNADWAERAVREGVSLSAEAALEAGVVEHIVPDSRALLAAIDGTSVETRGGTRRLAVADRAIEVREPGWRTRFLSIITQPTVAYLLFMIGIYGLILEALNPGATVPGVVGGISLLCALFAFQILPVNYAGLALIVLGIGLIVAEAFAPSFGMLGLGGMAAFVFGSIMLMDTDVPGYEIPLGLIGGLATASALLLLLIVVMFMRSRRQRVHTGREGLIGTRCVAIEDFDGEGRVRLQGESWLAVCATPVAREQTLVVTAVDGLTVTVEPATDRTFANQSPVENRHGVDP